MLSVYKIVCYGGFDKGARPNDIFRLWISKETSLLNTLLGQTRINLNLSMNK